ncbi:hypothetical protein [uncultured Ilyobacter sp.]|uniref:phage portal protein family protein n=1 Tax=uncultured Ilyobacter sp. TaxID=544433 RepID=UPI0029C0A5E2|nr:hypothetical protein [uncultured Ilyobacter sp.]
MFSKMKAFFRNNGEFEDKKPRKISSTLMKSVVEELIKIEGYYGIPVLTSDVVRQMMEDIDISYAARKISMGVASREWSISCMNEENKEYAKEIETRLSNLNVYKVIKSMDKSRYYGYGAYEIVWNEDYEIKELVELPQEYTFYDSEKGWYVTTGTKDINLDDPMKYMVIVYNESLVNVQGQSVLRPLQGIYEAKNSIMDKMRAIADRYGEVITVFAYDANEDEEQVKARAAQLKEMKGRDVLAIPTWEAGLKDSVHFINLADLKVEIHTNLEDRWKGEISKYILGADYSNANAGTGSYSRDKLQQIEQEKQEEEILKFTRDNFQKIIILDGLVQGYDPNDYYIKFEKEKDQKEEEQVNLIREQVETQKATTIKTISEAGYEVDEVYLSEHLGIPVEAIRKKEVKEFARRERGEHGYKKRY